MFGVGGVGNEFRDISTSSLISLMKTWIYTSPDFEADGCGGDRKMDWWISDTADCCTTDRVVVISRCPPSITRTVYC